MNVEPKDIEEKEEVGFFAVDIEATGESLEWDECFAIGWADCSYKRYKEQGLSAMTSGNAAFLLGEPFRFQHDDAVPSKAYTVDDRDGHVVSAITNEAAEDFDTTCTNAEKANLHVEWVKDFTFEELWKERSYEQRCWDEFWVKNQSALHRIQHPNEVNLYVTQKDMAYAFDVALRGAESRYKKVLIVTNTISFDSPWLCHVLNRNHLFGLGYNRDGSFRRPGGIEVNSYRNGVYGILPGNTVDKPWDSDPRYKAGLVDPHDHHPENDAKQTLEKLFVLMDIAAEDGGAF